MKSFRKLLLCLAVLTPLTANSQSSHRVIRNGTEVPSPRYAIDSLRLYGATPGQNLVMTRMETYPPRLLSLRRPWPSQAETGG